MVSANVKKMPHPYQERQAKVDAVEKRTVDAWVFEFTQITSIWGRAIVPYSQVSRAWELVEMIKFSAPERGVQGHNLFFERFDLWERLETICEEADLWYAHNADTLAALEIEAHAELDRIISEVEQEFGSDPIYL